VDFEFSEEQKMFREAVKDFVSTEVAPLIKEAEKNEEFPAHLYSRMGELGYLCPGYPAEIGGGGLGKIGDCILIEEICRGSSDGIGAGIMAHIGIGTLPIYYHGAEAQKQKYLLPAIKGQRIGAFGLTESNAGSDAAAIETTYKKEGDKYILNGSKIYITNGPICDFVNTAATVDRSKGYRGISMFVVDKDAPGFSCIKMNKFCCRSTSTGQLFFDNCVVPEENLIGEEGEGFRYLMETLDGGRISHGARSFGSTEAAFDAALQYAKERVQFGQPIARFQSISFRLAHLAMELEAARWLLYHTAWLHDQGKPCTKEAAMSKLFCSEVGQHVVNEAMQIHAGAAILEDSVINRYFRDSRLFTITEGTSEIMQLVIARQLGIR
jgi:alkylation response protein AidB-like acyl-CoA dehydrogenase